MRNFLVRLLVLFFVVAGLFVVVLSCGGGAKITPDIDKPGGVDIPVSFRRDTVYVDYVEYRSGNLPLIISVPHDGGKSDVAFTLRTKENCPDPSFATVRDSYTELLANLIDSVVHAVTGKYAFLVRCDIRRTYVDMNRERGFGVPGGSRQGVVYDLYHSRIRVARGLVTALHGRGLVIDIHGHGHVVKQVELGYLVSKVDLDRSDGELLAGVGAGSGGYSKGSSIFSLSKSNRGGANFVELLRGSSSLGYLLAKWGVPCVPNSDKLSPGVEPYFSGGYITKAHGSAFSVGGSVDAIQMEFDSVARSAERRREYAQKVANAVLEFISLNY